ncbi:hypothetical protein FRB99_001349 [Tulasnella sp. 403]|nr:hypothetical protein FRB99_001349 [Tulasnella sp. 403]
MAISMQIPGVTLAKTLTLDSTTFMSGNLHDEVRPRFSLQTRVSGFGPVTTINSHLAASGANRSLPAVTNEVGTVEWRSSAIGRPKTIVKTGSQGRSFTLGSLMKVYALGSKKYFGGLGEDEVRWTETDGTWQCTVNRKASKEKPRILAVLHSRIASRGTRIEVSNDGATQLDTIVLTALFVLHGEGDWKQFQRRAASSPYSFYQPRYTVRGRHVSALTLTLSTNSFLNGVLAVAGQIMYAMRTAGNRTSICKYTWEENSRLEEFASIEWHSTTLLGKLRSVLNYRGQKHTYEEFLYSSFLGHRMRRFGMPDFLPWMQWIENPPSWSCVSHPLRNPLAILERRFMTAGTTLDITIEGLEYLDALVISCIFVVHSPYDWKKPEIRRQIASTDSIESSGSNTPRRPGNTRSSSANIGEVRTLRDEDSPPGLPRRASESQLSRVSGDSEIPAYTPPPRGLVLNYREGSYTDPRPTGTPSGATSPISLEIAQAAHTMGVSQALLSALMLTTSSGSGSGSGRPAAARIEEVHEDVPPPSYHPPGYESS